MTKFKVGIIGTGFGAKVHAPMMNFHEGFDVVAIASVSRGNVEIAQQISGVEKVYTDWKEMLEQEPLDVVVIASAVHLHKEMTLAAFEKGIHVVCEKPMALHLFETEEMIHARNKSGKLGLINHEFRFLPARTKVKEIIESGVLGEIMHIRYECTFPSYQSLVSNPRGWLGKTETGGGMLGALGSHMVDSLHWWTNSTFQELFAALTTHVPEYKDDQGNVEHRTADDAYQIIGKLKNHATVTLELLSSAVQINNSWRLEVFGNKGTLVMKNDEQVFLSSDNGPLDKVELMSDLKAPDEMPAVAARYYNGFNRALDALYETLKSGKKHPNLADFENGHETQRVLDAVRLSAKEGRKIQI
ncbi:Gfo/Idh/MocA family oxidoreductase [Bacillus sp. FJAT-49736]|uniref:Gfo/Idh/MocA family protein n=1 Tax=Bacillus sp. FJAT-49736 TaxID=2833582 RepID=UPI001BC99C3F|nr:Gfo/Idh/MocA family oxidoreductase [Bacillus sp. FJAT-49736]MBS4172835.1 Gfo/Idh/MocA family oxidoreductase [Bacillus sp. FJAT-49736]